MPSSLSQEDRNGLATRFHFRRPSVLLLAGLPGRPVRGFVCWAQGPRWRRDRGSNPDALFPGHSLSRRAAYQFATSLPNWWGRKESTLGPTD